MPERYISDDELARMIRAVDPVPPEHEARIAAGEERAWVRIQERLADEPAPRRRRRLGWAWKVSLPALATAMVALFVIFVANPFAGPEPAAAQGLPPLRYEASALTLDEHLDRAQKQLATMPGPAEPLRESTTVAWYAHITMDGADRGTVISPEVVTITWDEDYNTRIFVTAGRPYVVGDGVQPPTRDDLAAEGTVLRDDLIPAEQSGYDGKPLPYQVPGSGLDFYREIIGAEVAAYEGGAAEAVRAIGPFLNYWTLTNAQHSDLLELLREYPDLELRGITHDRAGREAFAVSAVTATGYHEEILLVSTETGRIIASETIYLGDEPDFPLPTGSVMSYQLWGLDPD